MNPTPRGKRTPWRHLLAPAALCTLLIGCAAAPEAGHNTTEISAEEYGLMYQAAIEVLRDEGLTIAQQDYRFGRIVSQPQAAPTIAEPWRQSLGPGHQALESTLNSQRRVVQVNIEPIAEADRAEGEPIKPLPALAADQTGELRGTYVLRVEVTIEQLQVPRRYLTGSTSRGRVFGRLAAVPAEWEQRGITGAYWSPVGRDPYLEQHLLAQIVRGSMTAEDPQAEDADDDDDEQPDTTAAPPTEELTEEPTDE